MTIERLTVGELILWLQHYPDHLPVVVRSYEEGYDPVTTVETLTIAETPERTWYVGVYQQADTEGETAVLLASKYHQRETDEAT
ncbi:hypothetical protein ANRL4_04027 [Anaerolineae bacterium]|nr:hypothetical protein ANRL4_04027 [Anaerolineae bacterium]